MGEDKSVGVDCAFGGFLSFDMFTFNKGEKPMCGHKFGKGHAGYSVHGLVFLITFVSSSAVFAQPRCEIPLIATDSLFTETLYFGVFPEAHFCIDQRDSMNGHVERILMHPDPTGIFGARFVSPVGGLSSACFAEGAWYDYRPFVSENQRDTFRTMIWIGPGPRISLAWPTNLSTYFRELTLRYFDPNPGQYVNINMLTDSLLLFNDEIVTCTIYSVGPHGPTDVEPPSDGLPLNALLYQNYPNPFNPSTTISFSNPHLSSVILKVYDLLGKEVATLVNERLTTGLYERSFNAEGLTSGVYFYRLHAGGFVQTKKLLLLR